MSDTPRTDAEAEHVTNAYNDFVCSANYPDCPPMQVVPASFARTLELELREAREIAKKYEDRYFELWQKTQEVESNSPQPCPRCFKKGVMHINPSTLDWKCSRCGVTWDRYYLSGWNDGFKLLEKVQAHKEQP